MWLKLGGNDLQRPRIEVAEGISPLEGQVQNRVGLSTRKIPQLQQEGGGENESRCPCDGIQLGTTFDAVIPVTSNLLNYHYIRDMFSQDCHERPCPISYSIPDTSYQQYSQVQQFCQRKEVSVP